MAHEEREVILGEKLRSKGLTLALAESCTGGLVGHRLTNVPGSSDYYLGSVTAYANEAKNRILGVRLKTLDEAGAVSRQSVLEMASGVRRALGSDVGVSISGIAGPGGGTPEKPVGTVWIALSAPEGAWVRNCFFNGSRVDIKEQAAEAALILLENYLEGSLHAGG